MPKKPTMPERPKSYDQLWKEANRIQSRLKEGPIEDLGEGTRIIMRVVNVVLDLIDKLKRE